MVTEVLTFLIITQVSNGVKFCHCRSSSLMANVSPIAIAVG